MIDVNTYRQMHPKNFLTPLATTAEMLEHGVDMSSDTPPSSTFCILLPATMLGYGFHDKKWRSLAMSHIGPVTWNTEAFSRLVLKPKKKELIRALVTIHLTSKQAADIIEDKGNGLIILLHGSPGTGKTLTAESVAEIAGKPLYRVTCGDIGTDAEGVEKYLESVLLVGTIWDCVVLLDEADVFLEERQVTDLARNALVSVFLRVLEYYNGILVLTSNRVGTFDEAFKSRVQLAVHYPVLDEEGRFEIWSNFIRTLRDRKVDMDFNELDRKIPLLARNKLNGRQIRNLVWTAGQLAKYKGERLEYTHLEQVIEIANEFEEYLEKTHGHTDEEYAQAQGTRTS
jgi:SpoVK/Ycf46/Vps4 family AAA+-type ATPase